MNGRESLHMLNHMLESDMGSVKKFPYFSAEEVRDLLELLGISFPIRYAVWEYDGGLNVGLSEGVEADLRSTSDENLVVYKNKDRFSTLSSAVVVSIIYQVADLLDLQASLEELEQEFGSAIRENGSMEWWAKAYLLMELKPELRSKHFSIFKS